ncbi:MAG: hypothetical protein ABI068_05625 [Ktedonobacterales bacterium]
MVLDDDPSHVCHLPAHSGSDILGNANPAPGGERRRQSRWVWRPLALLQSALLVGLALAVYTLQHHIV